MRSQTVPSVTPARNQGDAARAAYLSRVARRVTRNELSNRQAAALVRRYITERRPISEQVFIKWLMEELPMGVKNRLVAKYRPLSVTPS